MKRKMLTTLATWMMALTLLPAVRADEPRTISFRVEYGDTFTNLFGSDWQKAYEQNKLTVLRKGRPITSPDILIEGMIVRVSSDVGLTPRAVARCGELRKRREQLAARLTALGLQIGDDLQARSVAADARQLLEDDLRFAADVDFVARQVEYLESLARHPATSTPEVRAVIPNEASRWRLYAVTGLLIAGAFASALYVARRKPRPQYPEADARYREVVAGLKEAFRGAGQKL